MPQCYYRELLRDPPVEVLDPERGRLLVCAGDWIRSDLAHRISRRDKRRLGPAQKSGWIQETDVEVEDGLPVLRRIPESSQFAHLVRSEGRELSVSARGYVLADDLPEAFLPLAKGPAPEGTHEPEIRPGHDTSRGWLVRLLDYERRRDWRGFRCSGEGPGIYTPGLEPVAVDPPTVAVVLTVHGRPDVTVACLEALYERTFYPEWRLVVVDDASTSGSWGLIYDALEEFHSLIHTGENVGYLQAANLGVEDAFEKGADLVLLLNSDVVVTPGWLSAMVRARLRTGAALVNPMCNDAGAISLPLSGQRGAIVRRLEGGRGYLDVADALALLRPCYPEAVTSVGNCLMISSEAWEKHGPFNAGVYGTGYGEECEIWAQVLKAGGKAVVADDAFVWHEGHGTHGQEAKAREKKGVETFISRHKRLYARKQHVMARWGQTTAPHRAQVRAASARGPQVLFVANDLGPWGGVACLLRIVHELNEAGCSASLGHLLTTDHGFKLTSGPKRFQNRAALSSLQGMAWQQGVVVATHWWSAVLAREIEAENEGVTLAAFWQDREDLFTDRKGRRTLGTQFADLYTQVPNRVVNAKWVAESAKKDYDADLTFEHIPVGVDTLLFRPGLRGKKLRVLSMWRPSTPRRGHELLRDTWTYLKKIYGQSISLETYGEAQPPEASDVHHGWLTQRQVADLVGQVDIFVEPSQFQGFGLPGLEALASGCCLVSTQNRGIDEYAQHGQNALVVPHGKLTQAIESVIEDRDLRGRLQDSARSSVLDFEWRNIGYRWACFMAQVHPEGSRFLEVVERAYTRAEKL